MTLYWQRRQAQWTPAKDPAKEEALAQYRNPYNLRKAIQERGRSLNRNTEANTMEFEKEVLHYLKRITDALEVLAAAPDPTLAHPSTVDGSLSFVAEKMTATVNEGKTYWKVQGGQFTKFGVTIWPEVLKAAGFEPDEMNPMKPVDLTGWTAHYILNEEGKANKVVRLERPQATAKANGKQPKAAPPTPDDGRRKQDLAGRIADMRASIDGAEGTVTLGYVADRAELAGLFPDRHEALKKMGEFNFPAGVKVEMAQKVSVKGALQVFDWLVEQAKQPA